VTVSLARNFFGTRFQLATDAEQRYLAALASLSGPPYRSAEAAFAYGAKDQRGVSIHRDGLIQKGIIWSPRRGQLDFTVPLFAEYLRENHPLGASTSLRTEVVSDDDQVSRLAAPENRSLEGRQVVASLQTLV
jgi:hypothetical protein